MQDVGDFWKVAQEEIRQDLRAMLRGAVRAGLAKHTILRV